MFEKKNRKKFVFFDLFLQKAAMESAQAAMEQLRLDMNAAAEAAEHSMAHQMAENEHLHGKNRDLTARLEASEADKKRQVNTLLNGCLVVLTLVVVVCRWSKPRAKLRR